MLPGGGATLSSFAAYALEKRSSKHPAQFGHGAVEGVAGPESANNAGAQTSFIPMLTLGIPGNAVMALMIGALTIHGIQPGPQIMTERPGMFWGMIASMWLGNLMLVIINLPLIGIWVQLLKVPYRFLYLAILLFCGIGVYTVSNSSAAVLLAAFFGVLGYVFTRLECEPAPMILGFVLGPLMEENLRRAMRISSGDPMIFLERPISLGLLDRRAGALRPGRAAGDPQQARGSVPGELNPPRSERPRPRGRPRLSIPAARQAAISRPGRPNSLASPCLSHTTRLPDLASVTIVALISSGRPGAHWPVLPTSIFVASRRAKSRISGATRSSIRMTSADCKARTARSVSNSGSPGPAPTNVTLPASAGMASALVWRRTESKSDCAGSRSGWARANRANACQNRRRAANERPDDCTALRQRRAASAQPAKPRGIMASSLPRIAWAKTGAAPSVEMPMTSGERLTMAPKEKSQ